MNAFFSSIHNKLSKFLFSITLFENISFFFSDDDSQNSKRKDEFRDSTWKDQTNDYRSKKKVN